ncbi:MAG: mandelate racemase/muconate lactonizing enzyme family protein [Granulosicoccus sp.]|nr:mandelate racemase/muconate lactonizing enzyme family protein [Granulosicoccus sp.]
MSDDRLEPVNFQVIVLRAPIAEPVRTAFGTMRDRPVVLVGISDDSGTTGWGEIWCNFPACGAEHRARLFQSEIVPLLSGKGFANPTECFNWLTSALHLLVNQTAEIGPVAQVIAGVDIALWDLYARRAGKPLYQLIRQQDDATPSLLEESADFIPVYASGLNPSNPEEKVRERLSAGYTAFKLKVGFDAALDRRNAEVLRELIGPECRLMVDANQAWNLSQAREMVTTLANVAPDWVEEPLPVDAPQSDWESLSRESTIPLAGGENLRGVEAFGEAIHSGVFRYIQPDIAKWGGISGTLDVVRHIHSAGLTYCPHWLGGGVGLLASAHLLKAVGGKGMLEVDANTNPLRDDLLTHTSENRLDADEDQRMRWQPRSAPGLGIELNPAIIDSYSTFRWASA